MSKFALNTMKFEDIRQQMIDYFTENNEFGGQFDFTNSNLSYFMDVMSYVTMIMSYNTSHIANNVFLDTTEVRKNAVSIAKQIGYKPKRPTPSKFQGKLIYKGSNFNTNSKLIINTRSPFIGTFGNIYTSTKPIVLTYKGNPTQLEGDYSLAEGVYHKYKIQNTNGNANFSFVINNKSVSDTDFALYVIPTSIVEDPDFDTKDLTNYLQYKWDLAFPFVIPSNSKTIYDTPIYFMEEDIVNEGFPRITFGNNTIGKIPSTSETIVCEYLETKGASVNNENLVSMPSMDLVEGSNNTFLYYDVSDLGEENKNVFSTTNFDNIYKNLYNRSFGGSDLEELESIKFNAPRFYSFVGRCVSKNDYMYYISTFSEIKSANVIGGNELFPSDNTKLGNIYISLVPNVDDTEFLNSSYIYLNPEFENDIKYKLDTISIISTKRQFYKPSYISINITPILEFENNISISDKNKIYQQVKSKLQSFSNENFTRLGVKFRESKVSSVIDSIDTITSSYLDLKYYLIINDQTVENMIDDINNFIFIPTISTKDDLGNIIGTTNFVKTNVQIVKDELLPSIDWSILDTVPDNIDDKDSFNKKIKLLNNSLLSMKPETTSIYSPLIHPSLNKKVYSRDYSDTAVLKIWFINNIMYSTGISFVDRFGVAVTVDIEEEGLNKYITFSLYQEEYKQANTYRVGELITSVNPYSITPTVSEQQTESLMNNFYIDESNYVFNGTPFNINQTDENTFYVEVRMVSYTSQLIIDGSNEIFSLYKVGANTTNEIIVDKLGLENWTFEHESTTSHAIIKYDGESIAYFERSHHNILSSNKKLKGLLNTSLEYNNVVSLLSSYTTGDYFIINTFFFVEDDNEYSFFNKGDIIFKNEYGELEKASIKKITSADSADNLITIYKQGDLFLYNDGYIMYDEESDDQIATNFTEVLVNPSTKTLDASKLLPINLSNNRVVRIVIPDEVYSIGGYFVYYADGITHKLQKPLYVKNEDNEWEEITTKKLYDGDIIVYNETNSIHSGGGWYLVGNKIDLAESPDANARLNVRADDIISIDNLTSLKSFMRVLNIDTQAITIANEQLEWFTNPPEDRVLNSGDLLICIDEINNKWTIYDDDYYNFHFDILNNNTSFPETLSNGTVFDVTLTNYLITNFAGMTQNIGYTDGDKIIYYDDSSWKKFVIPATNFFDLPDDTAYVGDMIQVNSLTGNFNNTPLIDSPRYQENLLINYNDILYYTGTHWIKLYPHNVYNDMSYDGENYINRTMLNDLGYNSDFRIEYNSNDLFNVYLDDIYHNTKIADVDYYSGKVTFVTSISGNLNKIEEVSTIEQKKLTSIFNYNNYAGVPIKMDKLQLKPITKPNGEVETDFDTLFSQYIVTNISEAINK